MPDQTKDPTRPQSSTIPAKPKELDKTPGTLGANASNSGITIDKPSTVETTHTQVVDRTSHIETPSTTLGASSSASTPQPSTSKTSAPSAAKKAAQSAIAEAKHVAAHAVEDTGAMLHRAGDAASASYAQLSRGADEVVQYGTAAAERAYARTRRVGSSIGSFASAHAIPLLVIGAGVTMLSLSIRRQRRYETTDVYFEPRRNAGLSYEPPYRSAEARRPRHVEGSEGSKELGPRLRDTGAMDGL